MKNQTRKHSFLETATNTGIGIVISFTISQVAHHYESFIQTYIWTGFTWHLSAASNVVMTTIITIASLIRGYIVRRCFNNIGTKS
jgi:hypothetical protein